MLQWVEPQNGLIWLFPWSPDLVGPENVFKPLGIISEAYGPVWIPVWGVFIGISRSKSAAQKPIFSTTDRPEAEIVTTTNRLLCGRSRSAFSNELPSDYLAPVRDGRPDKVAAADEAGEDDRHPKDFVSCPLGAHPKVTIFVNYIIM